MTYFKLEEERRLTMLAHVLTTVEFDGAQAFVVAWIRGATSGIKLEHSIESSPRPRPSGTLP